MEDDDVEEDVGEGDDREEDDEQQQQQQHDANLGGVTGLEDGLASRLIMTLERAATGERQSSSTPRGASSRDGRRFTPEEAGSSTREEANLSSGKGGDDESFGLGEAVVGAGDGDGDGDVEVEGAGKQV